MIKWKDNLFSSKGIISEKTIIPPKGKKKIEKYEIDGRNGVLIIDEKTYEPFVISIPCHLDSTRTTLDSVKEYLDGYGSLSFDGEREYEAVIQNQIDFNKIMQFRSFIVQFLVNPIAHDIAVSTQTVDSSPTTFTIDNATAEMQPTIEIVGSGDVSITVNNKTFHLYDLDSTKTYTLDCENKMITDENHNNVSNQMQNDFPTLIPGENTINYTGTITTFNISYKRAYL